MRTVKGQVVLNQKEQLALLQNAISSGNVDTLIKYVKGNAAEVKKEHERVVFGAFKDANGNTIEVGSWFDKEDREYITQVKILANGTRTKGFGIAKEDFKKYVAKLNSIVDKM